MSGQQHRIDPALGVELDLMRRISRLDPAARSRVLAWANATAPAPRAATAPAGVDAVARLAELWVELEARVGKGTLTAREAMAFVMQDPAPLPALRRVFDAIARDRTGAPSAHALGVALRGASNKRGGPFACRLDRTGAARWTVAR